MKRIKLTQGKYTLIDNCDYNLVSQHNWIAYKQPNKYTYYASAHIYRDDKRTSLRLGRLIMGLHFGDKRQVDHINRDGLDNRRENLRVCTHQQNQLNKRVYGKSKYRGVTWDKKAKNWKSQIVRNNVRKRLGNFDSEKEAARAYQIANLVYIEGER